MLQHAIMWIALLVSQYQGRGKILSSTILHCLQRWGKRQRLFPFQIMHCSWHYWISIKNSKYPRYNLKNIVSAHYSWILYLQICLLVKIYLQPSNQYLWDFCGQFGHTHVQSGKKFELPDSYVLSWGWTRQKLSAFLFQLLHYKQMSFLPSIWNYVSLIFVLFVTDFAL